MRGHIELRRVSKAYGANLALRSVSHHFAPGRIHALLGKNGSGKSTLIEILAGAIQPTEGELWVNGEQVHFASPRDAHDAGVVTVHQELSLIPSISVAENIFLGRLPKARHFGLPVVDWPELNRRTSELLGSLGIGIDPSVLVGSLTVGQQQSIEIAKAIACNPSILLLDEPTSALASREVEHLFGLIRQLRQRGVTIVYISHRMNEILEICDTCTVLRDGHYVGSVELAGVGSEQIVEMIFGEQHEIARSARGYTRGEPVLRVENLSRAGAFSDVTFDLHRGEILGIAGLLGSGRTEVQRAIFGGDPFDSGRISLNGTVVDRPTPRRMRNLGLAYTPEDRKHAALVQDLPIRENLTLASLDRLSVSGFIQSRLENRAVARQASELAIKMDSPEQKVSSLSGGNQQKVVVGNWLNTEPSVIFFDEPTRGIDLRAKHQMFDIIRAQADLGVSCLFVSSELEEVLQMSDRIIVMFEGRITAELDPRELTLAALYKACMKDTANV